MASKSTRLLLVVTAIGLLLLVAAGVAVALLAGSDGVRGEPRWLHVKLGPNIGEGPGSEGLVMDARDLPPLSTELATAIRDASTDEHVSGILLEVDEVGMGLAQVQGVRDALKAFQDAGKPCLAWAPSLTNRTYYLASACKELHLAPAGLIFVNGLSVTQTYYAGTFEKIGVSPNFEHVGDYKSAIEPYERTGPSEEASVAMDALLDSIYEQILSGIAESRGWSVEEARAMVNDPPLNPADALGREMVDALSYRDEILARVLAEEEDEDDLLKLKDYLEDRRADWRGGASEIAVVHAEGTIVDGSDGDQLFGGRMIGDVSLRKTLNKLRDDEDVAAVVLRVSSPGGSGSASDAIWRAIGELKEKKPVVVSMGDYAASGGYYIAVAGSYIFAEPATITGSIGVFGGKLNIGGTLEKLGVTTHTYQRGDYALLFSSMNDFSEADRAKFRSFLESFYQIFLDRVAAGRGMSKEAVHEVAQGRVWTGEQALERKLVDAVGGLDAAVAKAAELASLDPEQVSIRRLPERKGFLDQLMDEMTNPTTALDPALATPEVREAVQRALLLERVLQRSGVAALLPGDLVVE